MYYLTYICCSFFQSVFVLGRSYLPLAALGLSTLAQWADTLPAHVLQPYYVELLPHLDAYLKTTGSTTATDASSTVISSKSSKSKKKIPVKVRKTKEKVTVYSFVSLWRSEII